MQKTEHHHSRISYMIRGTSGQTRWGCEGVGWMCWSKKVKEVGRIKKADYLKR